MKNPAMPLPVLSLPPKLKPFASRHVAVIGAGAAGLVAARELVREGHRVVVFERGDQVGGTWVYTPTVESDPLGLDPRRTVVHSSLYKSLRTNLPREIMGFRDFPFAAKDDDSDDDHERDPRRFPGHREVLMYLKEFARTFGVEELVRLETEVVHASLVKSENKWKVRSKKRGVCNKILGVHDEIYDAVVVCNGHYSDPLIAEIPGIDKWAGKQIHSHNYRVPEPFQDQVVVLIESSASSSDISREIARVAKEVHIASRSIANDKIGKHPIYNNMWLHSMHVFPPALAPWLSFVGLPMKAITFTISELQSKWIAGILSNRIRLPSKEDMMEDIKVFYSMLEASGKAKRYTHDLCNHPFEYGDWLAIQCGCPPYEEWRKQMFFAAAKMRNAHPETFRDEWDYEDLIFQAHQDFSKYLPNAVNKY